MMHRSLALLSFGFMQELFFNGAAFRRRRRGEKKNFISGRLSAQTGGGSRFSADSWLRFREEEQGEREEGEGRAAERSRGGGAAERSRGGGVNTEGGRRKSRASGGRQKEEPQEKATTGSRTATN